ncbi:hypothetical protein FB451DRAFT_1360652 [Mycena latifolia]|nr:hypothetical protein FB451DRAFT_1360652 [Mycena latifolia]
MKFATSSAFKLQGFKFPSISECEAGSGEERRGRGLGIQRKHMECEVRASVVVEKRNRAIGPVMRALPPRALFQALLRPSSSSRGSLLVSAADTFPSFLLIRFASCSVNAQISDSLGARYTCGALLCVVHPWTVLPRRSLRHPRHLSSSALPVSPLLRLGARVEMPIPRPGGGHCDGVRFPRVLAVQKRGWPRLRSIARAGVAQPETGRVVAMVGWGHDSRAARQMTPRTKESMASGGIHSPQPRSADVKTRPGVSSLHLLRGFRSHG